MGPVPNIIADRRRLVLACELAAAILVPLFVLAFARGSLYSSEVCADPFYHVTMADFGPGFCMERTLPHMVMSVWKDHFSDKELLFHCLLSAVRTGERWVGLSGEPPFHVETLVFVSGLLISFVYAATALGVRHVHLYAWALVFISPFFAERLVFKP